MTDSDIPAIIKEAVLLKSVQLPEGTPIVKGYDWNDGIDFKKLLDTYRNSGFQATNVGLAIEEINKMLEARDEPLTLEEQEAANRDYIDACDNILGWKPGTKKRCTIFMGYTSNMVSCGVRESIRFLVEHSMIDCIVTTAGGVEEDLIKALAPTGIGSFELNGASLRQQGLNRIGNLLVPNDNYCKFEDWVTPHLDAMLALQKEKGVVWSPSKLIAYLGRQINDKSSICYWAARNGIPVFSPALTDGSLGDMMYFHSFRNPGLVLDILQDLKRLNTMSVRAIKTGMVILGGGLVKHHICNANLMRNGADFTVLVNTGTEYDGSDSGARPDEAVSWGKIKSSSTPVKVYADASLVFPLLVGKTFARHYWESKN